MSVMSDTLSPLLEVRRRRRNCLVCGKKFFFFIYLFRVCSSCCAVFDGLLVKYWASICGYLVLSSPFLLNLASSQSKTTADLTRDYIRNSQYLTNLSKAVGQLVLIGMHFTICYFAVPKNAHPFFGVDIFLDKRKQTYKHCRLHFTSVWTFRNDWEIDNRGRKTICNCPWIAKTGDKSQWYRRV